MSSSLSAANTKLETNDWIQLSTSEISSRRDTVGFTIAMGVALLVVLIVGGDLISAVIDTKRSLFSVFAFLVGVGAMVWLPWCLLWILRRGNFNFEINPRARFIRTWTTSFFCAETTSNTLLMILAHFNQLVKVMSKMAIESVSSYFCEQINPVLKLGTSIPLWLVRRDRSVFSILGVALIVPRRRLSV